MIDQSSDIVAPRRRRVEMADKTTRTIEARGFRVEGGSLILNLPVGCAAAYAPGTWLTVETAEGGQVKNNARDADGGNGNDGLVRMVPHAALTEAHEPCFAPPALPPC